MMTTSQPPRDILHQVSVPIRALSSITPQQAKIIVEAVQANGLAWAVQITDDYDGYMSILVEPTIHDDNQKSFFISGTAQHLELFEARDDDITLIDGFDGVEELQARLLNLIGPALGSPAHLGVVPPVYQDATIRNFNF